MNLSKTLRPGSHKSGFALVATISILVLLAVISVGLLSLSTVAIRTSGADAARANAQANARMALLLALGELQKSIGDDRRITADGSLFDGADQAQAVGVWESWSPRLSKDPTGVAPDYSGKKSSSFLRWLVSGEKDELSDVDWVKTPPTSEKQIELFREESDGFSLEAAALDVTAGNQYGSMAWAVSQENTKAKITVTGPEKGGRIANDDLQAQPRPTLALSKFFGSVESDWNLRAAKVIDLNQATLDEDLSSGSSDEPGGAHYTTASAGLLTNVVDGGLKTDLSLGFEMEESDFEDPSWSSGGETFPNPFMEGAEGLFSTPGVYQSQRPLYRPLSNKGTYDVQKAFWPANVHHHFPITSAPTFHSLRSFYRIPHHLYRTDDGLTVFERENDHVAGASEGARRGFFPPPSKTMSGEETQLGIRPVMDRVLFLISGGLSPSDELRIILTPVVTMWNPYNVALEIEGAVAHAWVDLPYDFRWKTYTAAGRIRTNEGMYMSGLMGEQFRDEGHGRSVNPFFYAAITADGEAISSTGKATPIRFEPGEVRVFAPAEQTHKDFNVLGSIRDRTVFLRPVDDLGQFSTKGGFSIPTRNDARSEGFRRKLGKDQLAQLTFRAIFDPARPGETNYPYYISLEDSTRAKGRNPSHEDRGQALADVLANNFTQSDKVEDFESPRVSYDQLASAPVPIGVLETYHQVARSGGSAQTADLVFTGNPRQPWMNPYITETNFKTGPQYEQRMRAVSSFNGVLQSANKGRSAYYGPSQTPSGRTHLSFFEIPSAPLLSLAALQHGDFSATPFAPANQFANSWASAYVKRNKVSEGELKADHCYLLNESLWDGWFFSGAAPTYSHSSNSGAPELWDTSIAKVSRTLSNVISDFFEDPETRPLRNPRMRPARTQGDPTELADALTEPQGCLKIAGELMVDGAFNVNSTSVEAWSAMLAGLRGSTFDVDDRSTDSGEKTPFPRFRDPVGLEEDPWHGYRTLSDGEIEELAEALVEEVRKRGPFQSLGEFVNRRISNDDLGLKGALQAAIDLSGLNDSAMQESFATSNYERSARENITPNDTGVGIPGYLTQADVLKPLGSVLTVRSDTFIIRAYGDSKDAEGNIIARAWAEATVQRVPDFVDPTDDPHTAIDELSIVNGEFGRRIKVVSFRYLPQSEVSL